MSSQNKPACRLFVIVARDAPTALIFRRGPSKWYHLIRWRMDQDLFEPGAWIKGKLYPERCDLSPDGELVVYMCHGGAYRPEYTDSWTAVSRAPWLFALALWPWGTTYGGGGRFVGNRRLILHGVGRGTHPDHPADGLEIVDGMADYHWSSGEIVGAEWLGHDETGRDVYIRDGKLFYWDRVEGAELLRCDRAGGEIVIRAARPFKWEKGHGAELPGRDKAGREMLIRDGQPFEWEKVDGAEWLGQDHAGRMIFTREGKLFRREEGVGRELADFNDLRPDPRPAPKWARKPLAGSR